MRDTGWQWVLVVAAWLAGIFVATCAHGCAAPGERLEAPPDAGPGLRLCRAKGESCDLPGACCDGLVCVGSYGVCAPIGELVWATPDASEEPCYALLDYSDSMPLLGYLGPAEDAFTLSGVTPVGYGAKAYEEPTWEAITVACGQSSRVIVVTDEGAQGGSEDAARRACVGASVYVVSTTGHRRTWPAWIQWRALTRSVTDIAMHVSEACGETL